MSDITQFIKRYISDRPHRCTPEGGGCISQAWCLRYKDGECFFIKSHPSSALMRAEEEGLRSLSQGIRVPKLRCSESLQGRHYLVLEYIHRRRPDVHFWKRLGRGLAALHRHVRSDRAGFHIANFIGSTPQSNTQEEDWLNFYAEQRLAPQYKMLRDKGHFSSRYDKGFSRFLQRLHNYLPTELPFSLLHGDLWHGNVLAGDDPVLIDPAPYFGHREADLAMTELFGGFHDEFYISYQREFPLEAGYADRRDIYHLYHLLNHVNIFGKSYLPQVLRIFGRYGID